jgi:hypothetical protein
VYEAHGVVFLPANRHGAGIRHAAGIAKRWVVLSLWTRSNQKAYADPATLSRSALPQGLPPALRFARTSRRQWRPRDPAPIFFLRRQRVPFSAARHVGSSPRRLGFEGNPPTTHRSVAAARRSR